MIRLLLIVTGMSIVLALQAPQEIKWICISRKLEDNKYELHLKALLRRPWHVYSQKLKAGGPIPTKITLDENPDFQTVGQPTEVGNIIAHRDPAFNMEVKYYADSVDFVQVVRFKKQNRLTVTGMVNYMICSDSRCKEPATTSLKWEIK